MNFLLGNDHFYPTKLKLESYALNLLKLDFIERLILIRGGRILLLKVEL